MQGKIFVNVSKELGGQIRALVWSKPWVLQFKRTWSLFIDIPFDYDTYGAVINNWFFCDLEFFYSIKAKEIFITVHWSHTVILNGVCRSNKHLTDVCKYNLLCWCPSPSAIKYTRLFQFKVSDRHKIFPTVCIILL